jgi:protein phosphatase
LQTDIHRVTLRPGDTLLLCTDGLTKPITDAGIARHLAAIPKEGAEAIARMLVDSANDAGGPDNITAVVGHFRGTE